MNFILKVVCRTHGRRPNEIGSRIKGQARAGNPSSEDVRHLEERVKRRAAAVPVNEHAHALSGTNQCHTKDQCWHDRGVLVTCYIRCGNLFFGVLYTLRFRGLRLFDFVQKHRRPLSLDETTDMILIHIGQGQIPNVNDQAAVRSTVQP